MWVLVVCQANICRSRTASVLLVEPLAEFGAKVASAGLNAPPAPGACPEVRAWLRAPVPAAVAPGEGAAGAPAALVPALVPPAPHVMAEYLDSPPVQLTEAMVEAADLILTASRDVSAGISTVSLGARVRTFTLRRAAAGARYVAAHLDAGELPPGAPPLPPGDDVEGRWHWFVGELDASRGQAAMSPAPDPERPDDVPDPHLGEVLHPVALRAVAEACTDLVVGVQSVFSAG